MSDWVDAMTLPAISRSLESMPVQATRGELKETMARRIGHELIEYLVISVYLFICFGSLLFYKSAILRGEGIEFTAFGLALVKALILGKFILLLQAVNAGERRNKPGMLLVDVLRTSFLFLVLLVVLNAVEEVVLGLFHGRAAREVLGEMAGGTLPEAIAVCALLLLVLIPYFSFRGLASRLGDGVLWRHFTERA
jgi:hypothetical protein